MAEFVEAEGLIHMVRPGQAEYTLCGDAFDLGSDIDDYVWNETRRKTVTCTSCARIIVACRGVKTRAEGS